MEIRNTFFEIYDSGPGSIYYIGMFIHFILKFYFLVSQRMESLRTNVCPPLIFYHHPQS